MIPDTFITVYSQQVTDYISGIHQLRRRLNSIDEVRITDTPEKNEQRAKLILKEMPDLIVWIEEDGWSLTLRRQGRPI